MRLRVVWGLRVTMASFSPTSAFSSVDFPALGRPMMETKPERNGISGLHLVGVADTVQAHPHPLHAALSGLEHFETKAIFFKHFACLRNVARHFAHQSGNRGCLFFVRTGAEIFLQQVEVS